VAALFQFRLNRGDSLMLDPQALHATLSRLGLDAWLEVVDAALRERFSTAGHGDFEQWRQALEELKQAGDAHARKLQLLKLSPWRKGPFDVGGVHIDSEWRSDLKWQRVRDGIAPLKGRNVLDVGCGNGYYALQMRAAGASSVIGIDPTLLYLVQFLAVNQFLQDASTFLLPLRLHELPLPAKRFDTTFSMGVLYHQRSPVEHIRQLRDTLRPEGQLVLETLYVPGDESYACTPADRYARMRNVWLLPTIAELSTWLRRSGFKDVQVVDQSRTSTDEQRSTEWMTFESLADALDPADPSKTVEGWPAPQRVVVTASAP
jgi:tRNA (mo5U34)-methyltransferase